MCDTPERAELLLNKSVEEGVVCAIGHIERYNPVASFVKNALDANQFGELISLSSKRVSNLPGRIRDVGVIFDFGVHDVLQIILLDDLNLLLSSSTRFALIQRSCQN